MVEEAQVETTQAGVPGCLSEGHYCGKHPSQKQAGEERIYFTHCSIYQFFIKSSEGRNSHKAGTWR